MKKMNRNLGEAKPLLWDVVLNNDVEDSNGEAWLVVKKDLPNSVSLQSMTAKKNVKKFLNKKLPLPKTLNLIRAKWINLGLEIVVRLV